MEPGGPSVRQNGGGPEGFAMKTLHRAVGTWGLGLALAVAAAPPGPALAGDEVPGKHYENRLVGFRFRPLNEWAAVPPGTDPDDPKVCGFYSDKAKFGGGVKPECTVYAFKVPRSEGVATPRDNGPAAPEDPPGGGGDPPKPPASDEDLENALADYRNSFRLKNTRDAVKRVLDGYKFFSDQVLSRMEEKKKKKLLSKIRTQDPVEKDIKDGDEVLTIIETSQPCALTNGEVIEVRIVAGFRRNEEFEVGVVYEIPGSEWKKYGNGCMASLRSLEFLEGAEIASARKDLADALVGKTGDERWIEEIKRKVGPGWDYVQTKNYLVVYDKNVKPDRVRLIAVQIEAIRKDVYEVMFPPDRPITAISVVRVCKDPQQYSAYGGPGGSAGYWNSGAQELVFYEDTSAKKDSLRVLNHEAFHQYIFYSVGSISPHDWFNEGHGDFFAGFNYDRSGRFIPAKFTWRTSEIKTAVGSKKYIPLKVFMSYSHQDYYGPLIGQNYAQGWSVIWFLRTSKNPAWKGMLETYFNTLKGEVTKWVDDEIAKAKEAGTWKEGWKPSFTPNHVEEAARTKALDSIFGGWDDKKWDRFEREWKDGF